MHITLIGMSSIGKSHWAQWLADNRGFKLVDCDGLIEQKLKAEGVHLDEAGTLGLSHWMGQPYEPQYTKSSQLYIELEKAVMRDVANMLQNTPENSDLVIDTTGSVLYIGEKIIEQLRKYSKIVYFEASSTHVEELFTRDLADPKPLIWDDVFEQRPSEKPEDARRRCYPKLLESRAQRYAQMAHVTIPYKQHKKLEANLDILLGQKP